MVARTNLQPSVNFLLDAHVPDTHFLPIGCCERDVAVHTQVWNEEDAEEEVLAMVARTGLHTSMGSMMRQIFYNATHSTPRFIKVWQVDAHGPCIHLDKICRKSY